MGWYDDFGAATYATTTSNLTAGVNIYYDKKFLDVVKSSLKLVSMGQRRPLPMGEGKTIEFFRYLNITPTVSDAILIEGRNPDATVITGQKIQAALKEWGAFSQHSSLIRKTHIDRNLAGVSELWGEHAGNIHDLITKNEVMANGAMPLAVDLSTTSTFSGTVDSASSTTIADTALSTNTDFGDADADMKQCLVTITGGTGYGQQRAVSDYDATDGSAEGLVTISPAWDVTPAADDTYTVTTCDELTTGDTLSYNAVLRARTNLAKYKAPKWAGGWYVGIVDPDTAEGLMKDTTWKNIQQYRDSVTGIFEGEIGKLAGVRFIEESAGFKFPNITRDSGTTSYGVGVNNPGTSYTNYSATGAVTSVPILGKNAFGVTTFRNQMGQLPRPMIRTKTSGPNTTSDPLDRVSTVGWMNEYVCKALNPLFAQQVWCYTG